MEVYKNKLIMIKEQKYKYKYNKKLSCSSNTVDFIRTIIQLQNEPEEVLSLIGLDIKNNILGFIEVSRGTLSGTQTNCREIFKRALLMNCKKIILCHNHLGGDPTPSKQDYHITEIVQEMAELFDIVLLDHIIIGDDNNYSIMSGNTI